MTTRARLEACSSFALSRVQLHRVQPLALWNPHLDAPIRTAGEEHVWVHAVPLDCVDGHAVPIEASQVVAAIGLAALVHLTRLATHKVHVLVPRELKQHMATGIGTGVGGRSAGRKPLPNTRK
jgi:hypothetical protein